MRMVQVSVNQVIDVVSVRDRLVATIGAMRVPIVVSGAIMTGRTVPGVLPADRNGVLVVMVAVVVVEMAVVEVIDVVIMDDGDVAAARSMYMNVFAIRVNLVRHIQLRFPFDGNAAVRWRVPGH